MRKFKRALTLHQSDACTQAEHNRCTCRCGGLLHGVDHKEYAEIEKQIILKKLAKRIDADGFVNVTCQRYRTQIANRTASIEK